MYNMKDYRFFHGDFLITSLRVFAVSIIATTICILLGHLDLGETYSIVFIIIELYALIESCCYVSKESTGGKSKLTDLKALFGLGVIMIIPAIIWIIIWIIIHCGVFDEPLFSKF